MTDELKAWAEEQAYERAKAEYMEKLNRIKAEIEVLPKTYPFVNHIDTYVKEDDVMKIIDKYREEQEDADND